MSAGYTGVQWNRQKRVYDAVLLALIVLVLGTYVGVSLATQPSITVETLLIRGMALTAFLLLHVILCIGPLARLDTRFLPLLFNRRHLGVTQRVEHEPSAGVERALAEVQTTHARRSDPREKARGPSARGLPQQRGHGDPEIPAHDDLQLRPRSVASHAQRDRPRAEGRRLVERDLRERSGRPRPEARRDATRGIAGAQHHRGGRRQRHEDEHEPGQPAVIGADATGGERAMHGSR